MKKYLATILLLIIALTAYTYTDISLETLTDFSAITGGITATKDPIILDTVDTGSIQVIFCPTDNCEETLLDFINNAKGYLHCAFYDIGLESVQNALITKYNNPDIDVKIVTDNQYFHKFPYNEFVIQDKSAYMHNKFCISGSKVITGSMNPTDNGANKNDNNLLIIESQELANNFELEFQELYGGTFKKGDPNALIVNLSNEETELIIESYFCPDDDCADAVVSEIQTANESIYFMTFSFTHDGIANNILIKYQESKETNNLIDIKGVFESRQNSKYSKFDVFNYQGIEVYTDANKNTMHHKVFIIDGKTVITGSMNPSNNGANNNDEALLIIHSRDLTKEFTNEFERIFNDAKEKAQLE
jgi:phosphatidylserine/phosphatidylglycerophosphate/cardiolipin synthase-like enzyme